MEYQIAPNYIDEILVDDSKAHKGLIKKANAVLKEFNTGEHYEFVNGECAIEMEFYDGIALATDGSGLYMTYPTTKEVSKSLRMQKRIQDYTGIYDDTITQHDIALAYGVLKFDKENNQKITTSRKMRSLQHETLVLMSADIFQDVYNMSEVGDYNMAARLVRDAALRFEFKWHEINDGWMDYILEMEKFEKEELERLHKEYDSPAVFKTPITQEEAAQALMSQIDKPDFGDRVYEFAQDLCNKAIQDIESKHNVVDANGVNYDGSDGVMWYDEIRDDFMRAVFEKVKTEKF